MTQTVFQFAIEYQSVILNDRNDVKIGKGQIALLAALLAAADQKGSLDNATADLTKRFDDNGKWRGQICLGLWREGIIAEVGAVNSKRLSRNSGLLRRWQLIDGDKARKKIESLKRWIDAIENPQSAATDAGKQFDNLTTQTIKESSNETI